MAAAQTKFLSEKASAGKTPIFGLKMLCSSSAYWRLKKSLQISGSAEVFHADQMLGHSPIQLYVR